MSNEQLSKDSSPTREVATDSDGSSQPQLKRARTGTSPIRIQAGGSHESGNQALPDFVAGASPAKFISAEQLKRINDELASMAIAHEIAMDPDFNVEKLKEARTDGLTKRVTEIATQAFYDSIRAKLQESPPDYESVFNLYAELKTLAIDASPTAARVFENIDVDEPRRQAERHCLDMRALLVAFIDKLALVCAPVRDEEIRQLKCVPDLVDMLKGTHVLLTNMKADTLNFSIKQTRHQFLEHAASYECEKFLKVLQLHPNAADETEAWLSEALDEYKRDNPQLESVTDKTLPSLLAIAYARLLDGHRHDITFPETLKYDMSRVMALVDERLRLSLTLCGVFIASNIAGRQVCESSDFKSALKTRLYAILDGVTLTNYTTQLDNIFLECRNQLEIALPANANIVTVLKSQVDALQNEDNSVRKLADDRIFTIVSRVLIGPTASSSPDGQRLPPGLSVVELELVQLISKFLAITIHNQKSFGQFYLERFNKLLKSSAPSTSNAAATSSTNVTIPVSSSDAGSEKK